MRQTRQPGPAPWPGVQLPFVRRTFSHLARRQLAHQQLADSSWPTGRRPLDSTARGLCALSPWACLVDVGQHHPQYPILDIKMAVLPQRRATGVTELQTSEQHFPLDTHLEADDLDPGRAQRTPHVTKHLMVVWIDDLQNRERTVCRIDKTDSHSFGSTSGILSTHLPPPSNG